MKKTYCAMVINITSTERLKPEKYNQRSKGFKYQVLNSELVKS